MGLELELWLGSGLGLGLGLGLEVAARRAEARGLEERWRRRGALVLANVVALTRPGSGLGSG